MQMPGGPERRTEWDCHWGSPSSHLGPCSPLWILPSSSILLQERQRKYLSLSPWDKATLSMVSPHACAYLGQTETSVSGHHSTCPPAPSGETPGAT